MEQIKPIAQNVDTIFTQGKLEKLSGQLVEFQRAKKAFGKSHSQWMDVNLILSKPTPIRNARQALAHIEKSYGAIKETEYKIKKLMVDKKIKQRDLAKRLLSPMEMFRDGLEREKLQIEIEEIDNQISTAAYYFEGALKTVQTYIDAYESICKAKNIGGFDEIDFEKEEEEYHIKTALLQSMRSVRATGRIDAGNQEYLEQCGINPGAAERFIMCFLNNQNNLGQIDISMDANMAFVHDCYLQFKNLSKKEAERCGISEQINKNTAYIKGKS